MKDKIIEVIDNNINTPFADHEFNSLVDQLAALMCYREVRAIMTAKAVYPFHKYERQMFDYLKQYYPEQTILQAIEKVKNEQK